MILYTTLQWLKQNINQCLNSWKTPQISPWRVIYVLTIFRYFIENSLCYNGHILYWVLWISIACILTESSWNVCQLALAVQWYDYFKIWHWKSKVNVMGGVESQGHTVGLTSYQPTSLTFHVNLLLHSWDTAISKFDLENWRSRSWMRSNVKVTQLAQHPLDALRFCVTSISLT